MRGTQNHLIVHEACGAAWDAMDDVIPPFIGVSYRYVQVERLIFQADKVHFL